jgi:di/tricarboxylate transporter
MLQRSAGAPAHPGTDMTAESAFVLALRVAAVVLFSLERVPIDVIALGMLVVLMVAGIVEPRTALLGFANESA